MQKIGNVVVQISSCIGKCLAVYALKCPNLKLHAYST